uniref:Ig-like domain-containing protein n=1 Tax=Spermophilus dauricus TaxID=99837 RepID=A0A8C9PNF4_SPEDA
MSAASAEGRSAASLSGLHPVALLPVPTDSPRQVQLRTRGSFAGGWMSAASAEGRSAASLSGLHPVALLPVPTDSPRQVQLRTSPSAVRGVIYSDLNFSVIMAWTVTMDPEPELTWTLNGRLCGTGEELFIRRLSRELLGTYVCTGRNSQQLLSSYPVTVSLPPEPRESPPPRTPAALRLVAADFRALLSTFQKPGRPFFLDQGLNP